MTSTTSLGHTHIQRFLVSFSSYFDISSFSSYFDIIIFPNNKAKDKLGLNILPFNSFSCERFFSGGRWLVYSCEDGAKFPLQIIRTMTLGEGG